MLCLGRGKEKGTGACCRVNQVRSEDLTLCRVHPGMNVALELLFQVKMNFPLNQLWTHPQDQSVTAYSLDPPFGSIWMYSWICQSGPPWTLPRTKPLALSGFLQQTHRYVLFRPASFTQGPPLRSGSVQLVPGPWVGPSSSRPVSASRSSLVSDPPPRPLCFWNPPSHSPMSPLELP